MQKAFKLSKERLEALKQELDYLKTVREKEVADLVCRKPAPLATCLKTASMTRQRMSRARLYSRIAEVEKYPLQVTCSSRRPSSEHRRGGYRFQGRRRGYGGPFQGGVPGRGLPGGGSVPASDFRRISLRQSPDRQQGGRGRFRRRACGRAPVQGAGNQQVEAGKKRQKQPGCPSCFFSIVRRSKQCPRKSKT